MFSINEKKMIEEVTNSSNIIAKGTSIKGNIEAHGNIRIEGQIVGDITTKSKLIVGESCIVEGNIIAQNAELAGEITGDVEVSELLLLKDSSKINGDITTHKLIVESGAVFNGLCKMGVKNKEVEFDDHKELEDQFL